LLNKCGGLKWLTGEPGMPAMIQELVKELARANGTTCDIVSQSVEANFLRLSQDDSELLQRSRIVSK